MRRRTSLAMLVTIALVAALAVWVQDFSGGEEIPTPFGTVTNGGSLGASVTDIGVKSGRRVLFVDFDDGTSFESLTNEALHVIVTPSIGALSHGAPLSSAFPIGAKLYGYKYTSRSALTERERDAERLLAVPLTFPQLFPGEFFASDSIMADPEISAFSSNNGVTFHRLADVTLERDARYAIIAVDDAVLSIRNLPWCGDGTFAQTGTYNVTLNPVALALADMNSDAVSDLVVINTYNDIAILPGSGDGTFGEKMNHETFNSQSSLVAADLDGDGIVDIVTANPTQQIISVFLGNGDGTMDEGTPYGGMGSGGPLSVEVADLNGDGNTDIVVSLFDSHQLRVLLGDGTGVFTPVPSTLFTHAYPGSLTLGDLDGDGIPDIVVTGQSALSVHLGNGDGTFRLPMQYSAAWLADVALADLDGDGLPDIVAASPMQNSLFVFRNLGAGVLSEPSIMPAGVSPLAIVLADFNDDRVPDIAAVNENFGNEAVSVFLGNGDGTFAPPVRYMTRPGSRAVATADINGDGRLDLVAVNFHDGTSSVFLGNLRDDAAEDCRVDPPTPPTSPPSTTPPSTTPPTMPSSMSSVGAFTSSHSSQF